MAGESLTQNRKRIRKQFYRALLEPQNWSLKSVGQFNYLEKEEILVFSILIFIEKTSFRC